MTSSVASFVSSVIREFLTSVDEKTKVKDVLSSFDKHFKNFYNSDATESSKSKKSSKSKSSTKTQMHEEGKCKHQFRIGMNKDSYCNKSVHNDTEFCEKHQPKVVNNPCEFVSKKGDVCGKESKEEQFENKYYCGLHFFHVTKNNEKQKTESKVSKSANTDLSESDTEVKTKKGGEGKKKGKEDSESKKKENKKTKKVQEVVSDESDVEDCD